MSQYKYQESRYEQDHRHVNHENILYPENHKRQCPDSRLFQRNPEETKISEVGGSHPKPFPPPPDELPMFAESYPPHLRRQSPSSSLSTKRKGNDRDESISERNAKRRRRQPSDFSKGVVMSAERPDFDEFRTRLWQQGVSGIMPPPSRPKSRVADTKMDASPTGLEDAISSRHQTTEGMTTPPGPASREVDPRQLREGVEIQSTPCPLTPLTPTPRQNDQKEGSPKNRGYVRRESPRKKRIEEVEVEFESPASSATRKRRALPSTTSDYSSGCMSPKQMPMAASPKKGSNEYEEIPSQAGLPSKRRRASTKSGSDELFISSSATQIPRAGIFKKTSIETVDKRYQTLPNYGIPQLLPSSPFDPLERSTPVALRLSQESRVGTPSPSEAESQGEQYLREKENEAGHYRDGKISRTLSTKADGSKETEMSVVVPLRTPQDALTTNQRLSADENTMIVPRRKSKWRRKPGTTDQNAPKSESSRGQGKRKRSRHSMTQREQQAYVERLRPQVGERKHKKPGKYFNTLLSRRS